MWSMIAKILAYPPVADWLIRKAAKRPYTHIYSADEKTRYMGRYWLFNPYNYDKPSRLPSIRIHNICQPDQDRDMHDHPWNCRTIIIKGWYLEERDSGLFIRKAGDTASIKFQEFHKIIGLSGNPVWTVFITWKYRGTWGFRVNGVKIPHKEYLADKTKVYE